MKKTKPRKPAAAVRVVDAYFEPARGSARQYDNGLRPPCALSKSEQRLWDETIVKLTWLEASDIYCAHAWCKEQAKYLSNTGRVTAATLARLQGLQNKLGLCPSARKRLDKARRPRLALLPAPDRTSKYFEPDGKA
jgi:hypothetical protein